MFLLKKKKKKKKSEIGCIVKQHAVFSPTGQLSTFFLNCILSCRVHEMKNIVHLYNDPYYIYMGMRAKRASGLVEEWNILLIKEHMFSCGDGDWVKETGDTHPQLTLVGYQLVDAEILKNIH